MTSRKWLLLLVGVEVLGAATASCSGGTAGTTGGVGGTTTSSSASTGGTGGTGGTPSSSASTGGTGGSPSSSASTGGTGGSPSSSASTSGTGGAGGTGGATTSASSASTGGAGGTSSSSSGAMDAGPDVDDGMVSTVYPAPHPAPPQLVSYGGPVLAAPRLVPVFFSNEDPLRQAGLMDFASKVGATPYWAATTSEYGVGAAASADPVALTEAAPATLDDSAIQAWLDGKLDGNDPSWPAADANTVYVLHYPAGTSITVEGLQSCADFHGYHSNTTLDGAHGNMNVAYVVIPPCTSLGDLQDLDATTATLSREILGAVTDPYPLDDPAWAVPDDAHFYWALAAGGSEAADLCSQFPLAFTKPAGLPYTVQRSWSNASALAGHDPCVPESPGEVYFNTAPVLTEVINVPNSPQEKGVAIPVGQSKTIELDLFSEGDTGGPWTVSAVDLQELMGQPAELQLSLDYDVGQNGQKQHLTITPLSSGAEGSSVFVLRSTLGAEELWWYGLVGD